MSMCICDLRISQLLERLIQLYEEGEVDDIPSFFLRSEVEQKMDSLIEMIDDLTQRIKTRKEGENNA